MPWQTPKTNWAVGDGVSNSDFNRIEGNMEWLKSNVDSMVGEISFVGRTTLRGRELKCNGAAISRTTYSDLFSVIGTTFGAGDGSTTFNLPDLRGEFIRGFDDGRGVDRGWVFGSWQADQFQGHGHRLHDGGATGNVGGTAVYTVPIRTIGNTLPDYVSDGTNGTPRFGTETRPRNIALMAVIKY